MKYRLFLVLPVIGLLAVFSGWILESGQSQKSSAEDQQFPIEIDYFLESVFIKVNNSEGQVDYTLRSPYLDHLSGDDISRIRQPEITIFQPQNQWLVSAQNAEHFHKLNWLELQNNARLERSGNRPITITTNRLLFEPDKDIIAADEPLKMRTDDAEINAEKAIFDMSGKIHRLHKTRAVYYNDQS